MSACMTGCHVRPWAWRQAGRHTHDRSRMALRGSEASRMGRASQGRSPRQPSPRRAKGCLSSMDPSWGGCIRVASCDGVMASEPIAPGNSTRPRTASACARRPRGPPRHLEVCSTWAMGLGSGPGEYPEGVPVEGQADQGALVDIEGDGIGQQCDRVVNCVRLHSSARAAVNAPALPHPRAAVAA